MPANKIARWVKLSDLTALRSDEAIAVLALAIEELAIAQSFVLIHGQERGAERYINAGGHIRFDADGNPGLWWSRSMLGMKSAFAT